MTIVILPPEGLFPPELHTVLPLALGDLALILLLKREGKDKSSKTNQDGLTGLTDKKMAAVGTEDPWLAACLVDCLADWLLNCLADCLAN